MSQVAATNHVIRNLHNLTDQWDEVWMFLDLTSRDRFESDARRYLGDNSNLRSATIGRADWEAVYAHFLGEA